MIYLWLIYVLLKHEESDVKVWELDSFSFLITRDYWYVIIINVVYLWMIYVLSKHEESDVNAWEPNSLSFEGLVVIEIQGIDYKFKLRSGFGC